VLNPDNCAAIAAAGPVVWLQADVETIVQRLASDPSTQARRPSLTGQDVASEVREVLLARWPLYERLATQVVKTEHRTPASIVDEIVAGLPAQGV
jgi:shikimate kinase